MLKHDQYQVFEEFGNATMPHQFRVVHTSTGIVVVGNCKSEQSKPNLLQELIQKLEAVLPEDAPRNGVEAENHALQAQLELMKQQIAVLMGQREKTEPKKRGRPKGYKVKKQVGAKDSDPPTHPEGFSSIDPSVAQSSTSTAPAFQEKIYKPGKTVAVSRVKGMPA